MRCFYSQDLELALPAGHPFPMEKFRVSKDMLLEGGILRPDEIVEVKPAGGHLLQRVHEVDYIRKIESGLLDRKEQLLLGLPATPQLFKRCAVEVEATRLACDAAISEGIGVCLAGGTHHAFRGHGEGYCVFNDVAIAIRDIQSRHPNIRIMVVDTDAHQGNGTAALLKDDPRVFTYSIHVGRNYPTKKAESSLDVETTRYVEGEMYLKQLFTSLADALDKFAPDLVIWVSGADNHRNDRFGQMFLSLKDIQRRDEVLLGAFVRNRIPVAVLYGGGYNREAQFTAKLHRNTVATAKKLAAQYRGL
ncbi:MAG: histone deacetylase [Verrucomicrobiae bacterium]|nr:histone deacetylase [Verrucomicrobiae bacterium]MCP5532596.1 histone deacetylase [Akkermansiaceae bacterium]MCP5544717.1 histone deacetylase [Akkermansiaceae bacterium]MCP5545857.1 histone deacetylase [Akkermansiaceae bacterium]